MHSYYRRFCSWRKYAKIIPGIYRHYKDKLYEVVGVATHSETEEELVVYRPLYGEYRLTVRPLAMFTEEVHVPEYQYQGPRFALVQAFK